MTPDEYQKLALRTEKTPTFVGRAQHGYVTEEIEMSRLLHGLLGVCTEAGELQDQVKKHLVYGKDFDPTNILEECGDLLWYIALALDATGFTMEECMKRNIAKLRARYPEGFTEAAALTRDLEKERDALTPIRTKCAGNDICKAMRSVLVIQKVCTVCGGEL